jgi:hypothetical protein
MKNFFPPFLALALALTASRAAAQPAFGGGGSLPAIGPMLSKLFGDKAAFTAKGDMKILDQAGQESVSLPVSFAVADGKIRTEVDMARMSGAQLPPEASMMKQLNLGLIVSVVRPDKKQVILIYPNLKGYTSMSTDDDATTNAVKEPKITKTELAKETVAGHPCVKNKVVIAADKGDAQEFTVWNATDLKDFPVQFQTAERGRIVQVTCKEIQQTKPADSQFEPPAGYTGYADMREMFMTMMQRSMPKPSPGADKTTAEEHPHPRER